MGPNELNKPQHSSTAALQHGCFAFDLKRSGPPTSNQRGLNKLMLAIIVSWIIGAPAMVCAELGDLFKYFQPYISVHEEYNSNIDLTPTNERDDFITTISPGFRFSTLPRAEVTRAQQAQTAEQKFGMDLDFNAGFVFYADKEDDNYTSLNGNLNAWYFFSPEFSFRVRDYLIRSDEIREADYSATAIEGQTLISRTTRRTPYYRNVFEPTVEYRFGRENTVALNYRNNIYEIDSQISEDSMENYINPRLTYWFNIHNGVSLEYGLTLGDFERSPDLTGHMGMGRYTYRFNPRTSIFGEYTQLWRNFDPPSVDYEVYRPSIGVAHAFSPTLSTTVQLGYYWANPNKGSTVDGPFFDVLLTQRAERTIYTLSLQGGYAEDFFTAENEGFTQNYRAIGRVGHQLLERMTIGIFGSYEWIKYYRGVYRGIVETGRQKDNIWAIGPNAAYQPFRWLTLSLEGSYRENNSNFDTADYTEYRGIFRIKASF